MLRSPSLLRRPLPVLVLFAAVSVLLLSAAWRHPTTTWPGGGTDPELSIWFLRWVPWAIAHGQNPLLTDRLDAPGGVNLMWQVSMPLAGVVLAPITLTAGPVVAYTTLLTVSVALSGFTCWLLLRRLTDGTAAPLAGALLYALSPYLLTQALLHAHATTAFLLPLMAIALDDAVLRPGAARRRSGVLLGALVAAQLLLAEELVAIAVIGGALVLVAVAVRPGALGRGRVRAALAPLAAAAATAAVVCALPLAVQLAGPDRPQGRLQPAGVFVTDLANLVAPTQVEAVAPQWATDLSDRYSGGVPEAGGYLGIPLLLVCAWTVAARRERAHVRVAAVVGAVALVLSLGPSLHVGGMDTGIPLPWRPLGELPLLGDLLPARLSLLVDLAAAVLLAELVASVATTRRSARVALALEGLTLLMLLPSIPFVTSERPQPALFTDATLAARIPEGSIALVLPPPGTTDVDAMYWQALSGMRFRMPEGYVYVSPRPGQRRTNQVDSATQRLVDDVLGGATPDAMRLDAVRAELRGWGVGSVVVGPGSGADRLVALAAAIVGRPPERIGGVDAWFGVGR